MPTPQELLDKLDERFILAEISERSYLELKANLIAKMGDASSPPSSRPSGVGPASGPKKNTSPLPATWEYPSLFLAAVQGNEKVVRTRLDDGESPNQYDDGDTPLGGACAQGHLEIVKLLVARGADLEARNCFQYTPLHQAAICGQAQVADLLAESGANLSAVENRLNTPLHRAAYEGHGQVVRVLLKHGASVNAANDCGMTPLMGAIGEKLHVAVVQALLDAGADVNSRDYEDNESPLHIVAFYGHSAIARMLLDHGADVNARNNQGDTPLRIAMDSERGEMANLLKRHGGKK